MSDSSYWSDVNTPTGSRGVSGGTRRFDLGYPAGLTPKLYTKIDFFEYRRDISTPNARRQGTGTIRMPVPEQYNDATGVRLTGETSLGALGAFAEFVAKGKGVGDIVESAIDSYNSAMNKSLINSVLEIAAVLPGGFDSTTQDLARSFSGIVPNPHVTTLFEGVQLKTFEFTWKVSPRSQQDAITLNSIIRRIKGRSLPSLLQVAGANYAFQYPDLVKIKIEGSKQFEETGFAFIESFSVNSSVGNSIAFYKDGQPVENTLSIRIKEIDVKTRENYENVGEESIFGSDSSSPQIPPAGER